MGRFEKRRKWDKFNEKQWNGKVIDQKIKKKQKQLILADKKNKEKCL